MPARAKQMFAIVWVIWRVTTAWALPPIPKVADDVTQHVIDPASSAPGAWEPMSGSKRVSVVDVRGKKALRMPCNFRGTRFERASWDRNLKLDMTICHGLQLSRLITMCETGIVEIIEEISQGFIMLLHQGHSPVLDFFNRTPLTASLRVCLDCIT